jgi:hypothetical protein
MNRLRAGGWRPVSWWAGGLVSGSRVIEGVFCARTHETSTMTEREGVSGEMGEAAGAGVVQIGKLGGARAYCGSARVRARVGGGEGRRGEALKLVDVREMTT